MTDAGETEIRKSVPEPATPMQSGKAGNVENSIANHKQKNN